MIRPEAAEKGGAVATQRLFFALWPEPVLQREFSKTAAALLPESAGRRVAPENLHATLVFLGSVDAAQRACVEAAASAVRVGDFSLKLDLFGYFRRPQVAWLGCRDFPEEMLQLVDQLSHGCAACGFPPEQRPFALHLTIARKVRRDPGRPPFMSLDWVIDRFALVESVSTPAGVRYRPLRFWGLEKNRDLD